MIYSTQAGELCQAKRITMVFVFLSKALIIEATNYAFTHLDKKTVFESMQ